jgi:hypothetical protein
VREGEPSESIQPCVISFVSALLQVAAFTETGSVEFEEPQAAKLIDKLSADVSQNNFREYFIPKA